MARFLGRLHRDNYTKELGVPRGKVFFGGFILVLRTFPEFATRSMQSLVEIGTAVHE